MICPVNNKEIFQELTIMDAELLLFVLVLQADIQKLQKNLKIRWINLLCRTILR